MGNSNFGCTKVGEFPKEELYFANGGWVGNIPMVCGGKDMHDKYELEGTFQTSCYTLQDNGTWKEDEKAKLVRGKRNQISGSVVINNQLFIPEFGGGKYAFLNHLNFEIVEPSKQPNTLQPMNIWGRLRGGSKNACIVKWDANTIMLIGVNWKETLFINMGNQTVTGGPKLMHGRDNHACNEMTVKGESYFIVTGGYGSQKSTEILAKSSFGKGWQKGKKLNITRQGIMFTLIVSFQVLTFQ